MFCETVLHTTFVLPRIFASLIFLAEMSLEKQLSFTKYSLFFSQTNDLVRDLFRDKDGFISLPFEIVAGGCVSKVRSG